MLIFEQNVGNTVLTSIMLKIIIRDMFKIIYRSNFKKVHNL